MYTETYSVVAQWFTLGIFLQVKPHELKRIQVDYRLSEDGLREMLTTWLKNGNATWFSLVHALKKMGQAAMATKIARKNGTCVHASISILSAKLQTQ